MISATLQEFGNFHPQVKLISVQSISNMNCFTLFTLSVKLSRKMTHSSSLMSKMSHTEVVHLLCFKTSFHMYWKADSKDLPKNC